MATLEAATAPGAAPRTVPCRAQIPLECEACCSAATAKSRRVSGTLPAAAIASSSARIVYSVFKVRTPSFILSPGRSPSDGHSTSTPVTPMRRSPVNYSDIVRDVTDEPRQVDRIREQFTRQAEAYARMRQATDEGALKGLVALARTAPSDRVLDVACGPAFLTMAFAEACGSAVGLDATDAQLDLARREAERRGLANLSFVSGEAEQLDVERRELRHRELPRRVPSLRRARSGSA